MCEKTITDNLIKIAKAYAKVTDRSLTAISKEFYGRGDFFEALRTKKHTISISRLDKMLNDFRDKWPPDKASKWPEIRPVCMSYSPHQG